MRCIILWIFENWFLIALALSIFWGIFAIKMYSTGLTVWAKIYQFQLNFVCSFVGWCAFHILTVRLKAPYTNITITDWILVILAILGITRGLTSWVFVISESAQSVINKIPSLLVSLFKKS